MIIIKYKMNFKYFLYHFIFIQITFKNIFHYHFQLHSIIIIPILCFISIIIDEYTPVYEVRCQQHAENRYARKSILSRFAE